VTLTGRPQAFVFLCILILGALTARAETTASVAVIVTAADAANISTNSAVLNGSVNPGGTEVAAWFEWGMKTSPGTRTEIRSIPAGTTSIRFSQTLTNLQPGTTYYFRALAYRSGTEGVRSDLKTFTTTATTDSFAVTTLEASAISATSAEIRGIANPGGTSTSAWLEWGLTRDTSNQTAHLNLGNGTAPANFAQSIRELQANTTYFFRAVAQREGGVAVRGDLRSFTTKTDTAVTTNVATLDASAVTSNSAELRGSLMTANANSASISFEWGTGAAAISNHTDAQALVTTAVAQNVAQMIRNLQPNTTYYFRAVGQAGMGAAVRGAVKSFTTSRVAPTVPQTSEVERGAVRSGYVIITPAASSGTPTPTVTFGTVSAGSVQSQAGVVPEPMTTDASMFIEIIPSISRNIAVALVNPSSAPNVVTLTMRDEDGTVLGSPAVVSLAAHQQVAKFINELFGSEIIGSGLRGSLSLHSSVAFAAVGLRFSGPIFSTLPLAAIGVVPGVPTSTSATGTIGGSTALIVPQFAIAGGWATHIALVNNSNAAVAGRIDLFDASGNPMFVGLNGETRSTFTFSIPIGGTFILAPRDLNGQSPL
jgi:hypothetical protein